jgi:BON domain-containing protein
MITRRSLAGTGSRALLRAAALVLLLLGAVVDGGCGRQTDDAPASAEQEKRASRDLPPSANTPRPLTADEKLAEDVKNAMLQAPALASEDIQIAVVQGLVVLAGTVSAPHLRDEAVQVAGSVPGVKRVQSKLNVKRR